MPKSRTGIMRLHFLAERYEREEPGLDAAALNDVASMMEIVRRAACWATHPDAARPGRFDSHVRLYLDAVEAGCVVAPLSIEVTTQHLLFDEEDETFVRWRNAVALVVDGLAAASEDRPLPDGFSKRLATEVARFGERLEPSESIEVEAPGRQPIVWTREARDRLATFGFRTHRGAVEIAGSVLAADVKRRTFRIWREQREGGDAISAPLSAEHEPIVLRALQEHETARLIVAGRAEMDESGAIVKLVSVDGVRRADEAPDSSAPSLLDQFRAILDDIPDEDWNDFPSDAASQHDHYLYGAPRRRR